MGLYPFRNSRPAAALTSSLIVAACLPIPNTYHLAPPIIGVYEYSDGRSLSGASVAVSTEPGDSSCATPAFRTTTDSLGTFRMPETKVHYRFIVLVPFDRVAPNYYFCASVADTLRPVFHGWARSTSRPDSLRCTQAMGVATPLVTCSGWLEWVPRGARLVRH